MILGVSLALFASIFCFVKIFVCDKISDGLLANLPKDKEGEPIIEKLKPDEKSLFDLKTKILETVIDSNGVLVGFAWERCFDTAVVDLSKEVSFATNETVPETITRVIL